MQTPAIVLLLLLSSTGCAKQAPVPPPDSQAVLRNIATGLGILGKSIGVIQTTVIAGNGQVWVSSEGPTKLISDDTTRAILTVTTQVAQAGIQADAVIRQLSALSAADRAKLLNLLVPVSQALSNLVANGFAGIKNPQTRQGVQLSLAALQSLLSGLQLAIAGSSAYGGYPHGYRTRNFATA